MKRMPLALALVLLGAPVPIFAAEQLVPAGSLLQCRMSEPRFSSKTAAVGDPVLCRLGMTALYGPSVLPYNSYLEGRFEAYKDPGHFVGKGWLQLTFSRMVIQPGTVIPIDTKVVNASGYRIDQEGRILGRGHAVRDTVEWMIPILWPIDLLTLPRRGPRPTLKAETQLTLKVMDDIEVPTSRPVERDGPRLQQRPASYAAPQPYAEPAEPIRQPVAQPAQQPMVAEAAPPRPMYAQVSYPPVYYVPPPPPPVYYAYPPRVMYVYPPQPMYYYPPQPMYMSPYGPYW